MTADLENLIVNWFKEDLKKLSQQVDRLEIITNRFHETPCPILKTHIEQHNKTEDRWWNLLRILLPYIIVAIGSGFAVYYKVM